MNFVVTLSNNGKVSLRTFYTIFSVAVFMFIAKPFIGFSLGELENQATESYSLLAKSFSKRKPEDLEDAKIKASDIKQKLTTPPEKISLTIAAVLGLFLPIGFISKLLAGKNFLNNFKAGLVPEEHPYLIIGKLTI